MKLILFFRSVATTDKCCAESNQPGKQVPKQMSSFEK